MDYMTARYRLPASFLIFARIAPCALDGQNINHYTGLSTDLPMVGLLATSFHAAVNRRYVGPELQQRQGNCESYAPQLSVGKLVNFRDTA